MEQEQEFESALQQIQPQDREGVMEIVTSWMEQGLEQGLAKGERNMVLRLLRKRLGGLDRATELRIEALPAEALEQLGEALLDFSGPDDLDAWLQAHG
jgi:hypothetical protein